MWIFEMKELIVIFLNMKVNRKTIRSLHIARAFYVNNKL